MLQLKFGGEIESFILCIKFGVIGVNLSAWRRRLKNKKQMAECINHCYEHAHRKGGMMIGMIFKTLLMPDVIIIL